MFNVVPKKKASFANVDSYFIFFFLFVCIFFILLLSELELMVAKLLAFSAMTMSLLQSRKMVERDREGIYCFLFFSFEMSKSRYKLYCIVYKWLTCCSLCNRLLSKNLLCCALNSMLCCYITCLSFTALLYMAQYF